MWAGGESDTCCSSDPEEFGSSSGREGEEEAGLAAHTAGSRLTNRPD